MRLLGHVRIQVLAPGHHLHAESPADIRHPPALVAQADHAEPLAVQAGADGPLPAAADAERRAAGPPGQFQPLVLLGDVPEQRQDQAPGQLGRGRADATGAAHRDPARGGRLQVDRRVAHARGDQQPQPRQLAEPLGVEVGTLPHRHYHVVRLQGTDQRLRPLDMLGEHVDLAQGAHRRPVRAGEGNLLIIIEDRDPHGPDTTAPSGSEKRHR